MNYFKRLLIAACLLTGCASETSETLSAQGQLFVGSWTWEAGSTLAISCPAANLQMDIDVAGETFTNSGDGAVLVTTDANGCVYRFVVEGERATLESEQECAGVPGGDEGSPPATVRTVSASMELSEDVLVWESRSELEGDCGSTLSGTATRVQ